MVITVLQQVWINLSTVNIVCVPYVVTCHPLNVSVRDSEEALVTYGALGRGSVFIPGTQTDILCP